PVAALAAWAVLAYPRDEIEAEGRRRVDSLGAVSATAALGGLVFALIDGPVRGWTDRAVVAAGALALVAAIAFFDVERSQVRPMLPLGLFRRRRFAAANGATALVYFVLGGVFFLLTLQLQRVMGYSALEAGLAQLPVS